MRTKNLITTFTILCLVLLLESSVGHAGVCADWDWVGNKRTLKVWINVPADEELDGVKVSDAVNAAKEEINSAGGDWKLEEGTKEDHDIEIKLAEIDEDVGGAMNDFTMINRQREVSKRTVIIDPTPEGGEKWGNTGEKFDPTTVITHELLHKLRIKHQTGKTTGESGNMADPSLPGDHQKKLSNDDKNDIKESDDIPIQKDSQSAGPGSPGQKEFQFGSTSVIFSAQVFQTDVEIGFSLTSDCETVIDPFDIPHFDGYRIIRGVLLDITGTTVDEASGIVSFVLEYMDDGFDLDDLEYLPVEEKTLTVFIYNITKGFWEKADALNVSQDELGNFFAFDLDVDDLLSGNNFGFDVHEPSTAFTFVAIGGLEVPYPPNGAVDIPLDANLHWPKSEEAVSYDVYFGTDFDAVANADTSDTTGIYRARLSTNSYDPGGLEVCYTYYWKVKPVIEEIPDEPPDDEPDPDEPPDEPWPVPPPKPPPDPNWPWPPPNEPPIIVDSAITTSDVRIYADMYIGDVWSFTTAGRKATNPYPVDGATDVDPNAILSWTPGCFAAFHDVYLGTDFDAVANADTSDTTGIYRARLAFDTDTFTPQGLALGATYYWKIDEVVPTVEGVAIVCKGDLWSFTTGVESEADITTLEFVELALNTIDTIFYHDLCQLTLEEVDQLEDYSKIYIMACHDLRIALTKQVLPNLDPNDIADFEYLINNCYILDEIVAFNKLLDNPNVSLETKTEAKKQMENSLKDILKELIDKLPGPFSKLRGTLEGLLEIISEVLAVIRGSTKIAILVDNFEAYNDLPLDDPNSNRIFETWIDGLGFVYPLPGHPGNGTGSMVNISTDVIYGGAQSMRFSYDNSGSYRKAFYSETERTFGTGQDWTAEGVKALSLWFHGDSTNDPEPMYVAVEDITGMSAVVFLEDIDATLIEAWQGWAICLEQFTDQGVNLTEVNSIAIGLGDRDNPQPGGTGTVYFDDVKLYAPGYEDPQPCCDDDDVPENKDCDGKEYEIYTASERGTYYITVSANDSFGDSECDVEATLVEESYSGQNAATEQNTETITIPAGTSKTFTTKLYEDGPPFRPNRPFSLTVKVKCPSKADSKCRFDLHVGISYR